MLSEAPIKLVDATAKYLRAPVEPRWYLAYGSNLSTSGFLVARHITPLAKKVVLAKGIELAFDHHGIPYVEPRFANIRFVRETVPEFDLEKEWTGRGALLGVAFLLTPQDFVQILKVEGAGTLYQPLEVQANVVSEYNRVLEETVDVYTLMTEERRTRPGQASLRYMSLIRNENKMPPSYIRYLESTPHFTPISTRQQWGLSVVRATWARFMFFFFRKMAQYADKDGNLPIWMKTTRATIHGCMWFAYDWFEKWVFGDGEVS
ncbi:hypothetical protein BT96DRAFT_1021255 [Gymnopus androsaceus JB14]|uniref:gamma-glutamylcyclotransferase n=1 Tax=Gymnopus androsaceus JB14 TaxID=1447944 RepID=A0A6A4HFT0_9AGAR|nr:hypothetical protein BT96DRAFT_1021255 [Gymnopus androsaceus JB14]